MIRRAWTGVLMAVLMSGPALADESMAVFRGLLADYEAVRLNLYNEDYESVESSARSLVREAETRLGGRAEDGSRSPEIRSSELRSLLEEIRRRAALLETAPDLSSAREAFFDLTRPMVKIRHLAGDESTLVAYCPMAAKAWLQAEGELGNPYFGPAMPTCGEVVSGSAAPGGA